MNRDDGITVLKFLSLTCTALFAGGAVFINIAEHPARKALTPSQALIEWKESYERASFWQVGTGEGCDGLFNASCVNELPACFVSLRVPGQQCRGRVPRGPRDDLPDGGERVGDEWLYLRRGGAVHAACHDAHQQDAQERAEEAG